MRALVRVRVQVRAQVVALERPLVPVPPSEQPPGLPRKSSLMPGTTRDLQGQGLGLGLQHQRPRETVRAPRVRVLRVARPMAPQPPLMVGTQAREVRCWDLGHKGGGGEQGGVLVTCVATTLLFGVDLKVEALSWVWVCGCGCDPVRECLPCVLLWDKWMSGIPRRSGPPDPQLHWLFTYACFEDVCWWCVGLAWQRRQRSRRR